MEKIYKCDFCGTNALVVNSRGGCVSCGAPIKRENIEILREEIYPYREPYRGLVTSASTLTFGSCSGSVTMHRW